MRDITDVLYSDGSDQTEGGKLVVQDGEGATVGAMPLNQDQLHK